ncbi:M48 family metalloprotease [Pantanalinema rosaneae CENA516]|uniref:M48 family metalloprotease n=1 Tax=Pantanalinema rosaneae TaxID=1620701 RepID=UPI003D6DD295
MNYYHRSLLINALRTMPLSAVCVLLLSPTVLAQTTPTTTTTGSTTVTVETVNNNNPVPPPSAPPAATASPVVSGSTTTTTTTTSGTVQTTSGQPNTSSSSNPPTAATPSPTPSATATAEAIPVQPISGTNPTATTTSAPTLTSTPVNTVTGTPIVGYPGQMMYPIAVPVPNQVPGQTVYPTNYPANYPANYPVNYPANYPANYPVAYPTYPPGVYPVAVPGQPTNPGGISVQVTTSVGIPNQPVYPTTLPGQAVYPGTYPVVNPGQMVYPTGVPGQPVYATPLPGQVMYPGMAVPGVYPNGVPIVTPIPGQPISPTPPATNGNSVWVNNPNSQPATNAATQLTAITNPALLPADMQLVWQRINTSQSQRLSNAELTSLQQLVKNHPQFIPAQLRLVDALNAAARSNEALSALEQAATLHPNQPELVRSQVNALMKANRWMEASIAARQFVTSNPSSPLTPELTTLAEQALQRVQSEAQRTSKGNLIGNVLSNGLNFLVGGKPNTNLVQNAITSLQGESSIGSQMAREMLNKVEVINDTEVVNYINELGQRLARVAGRADLQHEFYVVRDSNATASALPGGKIFINAGAIANANSEAALANVIARQLGHSVLSHPMQLVNKGNVTNTIAQLLPKVGGLINPKIGEVTNGVMGSVINGVVGNVISGLFKPNYTSQMTNQAEQVGARILASAGYNNNATGNTNRFAQVKTRVQQLLNSGTLPWWSLGN